MLTGTIDALAERLDTIQRDAALTDRAVAAAIQIFTRTGDFPDHLEGGGDVESTLLELTWLLFGAAPAIEPRYLLVSSMHLDLVLAEDRPFDSVFDELRAIDGAKVADDDAESPQWLAEYRELGRQTSADEDRVDWLKEQLHAARALLQQHHEEVVEFTRKVLDTIATDFDRDVQTGVLSPLGASDFSVDDPKEALKLAREKQREGDLEAAMPLFSFYLESAPEDADVLVERGILRAALEDLGSACEDFDAALAAKTDHLLARLNRGLARHSLGEVNAAIEDYDRALEQVDDNPEIWTNRGIARFSAKDYRGAIADLDRAIELDDQLAMAYFQRGNIRRVLQEVGYALRDYTRAIELRPDFVDAIAARAYLHLQLEQLDEANADLDQAIRLQPSDPSLYYNRAHVHLLAENVKAAIEDYDRALALDPEDVEALSNRGAAHMLKGSLDAAVADWEEAIAIDPYYPTPYLKRASMWIATDQPEEAARDLQIALDNAPNDWSLREDVEETLNELLDELGFDHPD